MMANCMAPIDSSTSTRMTFLSSVTPRTVIEDIQELVAIFGTVNNNIEMTVARSDPGFYVFVTKRVAKIQ
jgi:hypothetical protein